MAEGKKISYFESDKYYDVLVNNNLFSILEILFHIGTKLKLLFFSKIKKMNVLRFLYSLCTTVVITILVIKNKL